VKDGNYPIMQVTAFVNNGPRFFLGLLSELKNIIGADKSLRLIKNTLLTPIRELTWAVKRSNGVRTGLQKPCAFGLKFIGGNVW
jgi:hypothetical protein